LGRIISGYLLFIIFTERFFFGESSQFDGKYLKEFRFKVRVLLALMMTDHFGVFLLTVGWEKSGVLLGCFWRAIFSGPPFLSER
jgi:hypothetical protein